MLFSILLLPLDILYYHHLLPSHLHRLQYSPYWAPDRLYHTPRPAPCCMSCLLSVNFWRCFLIVFRLASVASTTSYVVIRPCDWASSMMRSESSGMAARISFSCMIFFSSRDTCEPSDWRKNSTQDCQLALSVRMVPCVWRSAR